MTHGKASVPPARSFPAARIGSFGHEERQGARFGDGYVRALGAAALVVLLFVVPPDVPAQEPHGVSRSALEALAHARINAHRLGEGLAPLAYDARIAAAARRHSEAMAARKVAISHDGFEARERRISEAIPLTGMAENVGFNTYPVDKTVIAAVSGWLASPGHRKNIEGDYNVTGIGIARGSNGAWYFTQIFVKRTRGRTAHPGS